MEYLMTYGWAILIIAVVLAALFALGIFNGSNLVTNACQASTGYLCQNAVFFHGIIGQGQAGNILVTVGQNTGTAWVSANFVFVPQGTPYVGGLPSISFISYPANTILSNQGLQSGGIATVTLPVNGFITNQINIGQPLTGSIWAQYVYIYTAGGIQQTGVSDAQIAAITIKAS
jgi:hypothetical protein